ncbi:Holliday junction resolvase RuvX [Actinomycetota bacterium]
MRPGVRVGVDVGSVRVGVALSDPGGILATPETTLTRDEEGGSDLEALAALVHEREALEVVVGLPLSLSGEESHAAGIARAYATTLAGRVAPVPVRLVDERLTTVDAHRGLRASGVDGRRARHVVDQAAAVLILQGALDLERSSGRPPGETVTRRKPRTAGRKPRTKDRDR